MQVNMDQGPISMQTNSEPRTYFHANKHQRTYFHANEPGPRTYFHANEPRTYFHTNEPQTKYLFPCKWTPDQGPISMQMNPRPRTYFHANEPQGQGPPLFQDNIPWFLTVVFKIGVPLNYSSNLQQSCELGVLCCCSKLTLLTCSQAFFNASFFFLSSSSMTAWILALSFSTILRFFIRSVYCKQHFRVYEHNKKDLSRLQ